MLLVIAIVLGILWLLGILVIHITNPLLHLVLVVAVIVLIFDFISRRRRA